jgi:hypothetical protein
MSAQQILELDLQDVLKGLHGLATDKDTPAASRVRAWESIGKHLGFFLRDNLQRDGLAGLLAGLPAAQRVELVERLRQIAGAQVQSQPRLIEQPVDNSEGEDSR